MDTGQTAINLYSNPDSGGTTANDSRHPTVIDLFAGVGGLTLGAIRAGFKVELAVELDKHALASHKKNFPLFRHLAQDVSTLDGKSLLQNAELEAGKLDGLIGGPPCQGFSIIGKRNAIDPRNNLFIKFLQLVSECRPKFFLIENVPGLLASRYHNIRETAFSYVADYDLLPPFKLKASDFGSPTSRERVFFIGYLPGLLAPIHPTYFEQQKVSNPVKVNDALYGLPAYIRSDWLEEPQSWRRVKPLPDSPYGKRIVGMIPEGVGDQDAIKKYTEKSILSGCFGTRHSTELKDRYRKLKPGKTDPISKATRLDANGFCPTLRAGTDADRGSYQAVRPIHPTAARVITPREAARLQGFPDWFQFAPTKWHSFRQIGNSVSPILAEVVLKAIYNHMSYRNRYE